MSPESKPGTAFQRHGSAIPSDREARLGVQCRLLASPNGNPHLPNSIRMENIMVRSIQLLFIAGLTILCSVAFAGGDDDKPANVAVHIRDYCDPASFNQAIG